MEKLIIKTQKRIQFIDITEQVRNIVKDSKIKDGMCFVFVPHTTAAITINENADPDVRDDIITHLGKIVPSDGYYKHSENNSDAHIKASLLGFSVAIPIEDNNLVLGTWQGIYFAEFDGPRQRQFFVQIK